MRNSAGKILSIHERFRGFLPVVVDVETGGFDASRDALLEVAAVILTIDEDGKLVPKETVHHHIEPFPGAHMAQESLEVTGIKPFNPFRFALEEKKGLSSVFDTVRKELGATRCQRAVLVGHNATFDLSFMQAAVARCKIKKDPFHHFTTFDTAALSALAFGQTVLARALKCAGIPFDLNEAHSALYDAEKTAELFCYIVNRWHDLGGWMPG
ncbi:MAG: ribonuclease T [marine bacterium B5-7]|nr:MAG: ribonuclease T [marine bacterium B5-7]